MTSVHCCGRFSLCIVYVEVCCSRGGWLLYIILVADGVWIGGVSVGGRLGVVGGSTVQRQSCLRGGDNCLES